MSDRVVQSFHDCDGRGGQSVHSYQSVWMSHWTRTSCNVAPQLHNHSSNTSGNKEDDCNTKQHHLMSGVEIASDIFRSAKGFEEVEVRTFGIMNESLTTSSKNLRNERLGFQPFPIVDLCQKTGSICVSKNDQDNNHMEASRPQIDHKFEYNTSGNHFPSVLALAPPAMDTLSRECHFQPDGVSQNTAKRVKSHIFPGDTSFPVSRPSEDNIIGSTSHIVPRRFNHSEYIFDSGRPAVPSFMSRQEEINHLSSTLASEERLSNTKLTVLDKERCEYHRHSAFLVCEEKMNNCSMSGKSVTPYVRQDNSTLLLNVPYMSNNHSPVFAGEQYQRNSPGRLFPSQSSHPEMTKLEGIAGGPPRFSQTSHSLLIKKKNDVNLCEENQNFRESRVSAQFEGNTFSRPHSLSPLFGQGQHGLKLQPLGSSSDSEGEENVQYLKASEVPKNESSIETNTMDMDSLKEKNHLSGACASPSNKVIAVDPNLSQGTIDLAGEEAGCRQPITELPDMNLLPTLPAAENSMDNAAPSTSRTESLDIELLLHGQPCNSKANHCPDSALEPDPCSRWIKRLKLSASHSFALGTKSSNLGFVSSHEKPSKFSKIMRGSTSSSEPTLGNGDPSYEDTAKKNEDITLLHSWIQRWRHNRAGTPQKKPEATVGCEPQSSKVALEGLQKKQFPSIAAMALMGKAMTGFQPCKFQKRGSFVVWNTKGF